jgi:hypothetical protein
MSAAKKKMSKRATAIENGEPVIAFTFRMRADQLVALKQIQEDQGVPVTQQLRRAIDLWLARQ